MASVARMNFLLAVKPASRCAVLASGARHNARMSETIIRSFVPRHKAILVIERDEEGYCVASVPQIPACHTQARSLDEVTQRIREAIELCLEVEGAPEHSLEFVGIQRVTIAA